MIALGIVGNQPRIPAGTGQRNQAIARREIATRRGFQGFDKTHRPAHADHAQPREQAVVQRIGAGQRTGVTQRQLGTDLRHAGFQRNNRNALLQRLVRRTGKPRHILQAFQVQADGSDARLIEQHIHQFGNAQLCLVTHRCHVGHRQRTVAHRQVIGEVAALGQHRHALLHRLATMGYRPQRRTVQVVKQAVAVGAEQGHVTRCV